MYDEALSYLNEPSKVKAALPIAYILEQAGVAVYDNGGVLSALCPFHNDRSPSFDVFIYNGKPRWGCWSCGIGGDVFDLIQRLWPMGFRDSVEAGKRALAKMQAEGWQGPQPRDPLGWDEDAATKLYESAAVAPDVVQALIDAKGWKLSAEALISRWGLRAVGREVLCPYFDNDSHLLALKHRPATGARPWISLPGSQLRGRFYGEHRIGGSESRPYILCEGESDTWHADRWLTDYCAIGLPAGVGATPAGLDVLAGHEVVLAFDGDEPGRLGRERWREALQSVGCTVQYMDIPDGRDLTEVLCGIH